MSARPVPHDVDAEVALLGALVLQRDTIVRIEPLLGAGDFWDERNAALYAAVCALYAERIPPDVSTLASELQRRGQLAAVGGLARIAEVMQRVPTAVHAEFYAASIRRAALLRRLITVGGQIAGLGYETAPDTEGVLAEAERLLLAVTQAGRPVVSETLEGAMDTYVDRLQARMAGTLPPEGWSFGLPGLDYLTNGARKGKVIVLTGESGGGKSTAAVALALNLKANGARVGMFSLEMLADELAERALANRAWVDSARLAAADLTPEEFERVVVANAEAGAAPLIPLVTGGGFSLRDVTATARKWVTEGGLDVLVVDYLQLMRLPSGDRVTELDALANGLKALAMELGVTLITASQLSKAAVGKDAREWDDYMRGSQAIKQAADLTIVVAPQGPRPTDGTRPWPLTLHVTKHRGGATGDVPALWWLAYSRIAEADYRHDDGGWT